MHNNMLYLKSANRNKQVYVWNCCGVPSCYYQILAHGFAKVLTVLLL